MAKTVAINLVFNTKTGQITAARGELNQLSKATNNAAISGSKASSSFGSMQASIGKLAGIAGIAVSVAALTNAMKNQIKAALQLKTQMEDLSSAITSLVYVNAENVLSTGESINAQEKWNLSLQTSQKLTDELSKSASKLGVSVSDIAAVYKSFAATGMKNMSFEQTTKAVELLTIAGKASSTEMSQLAMVIDSVGSGMLPLTGTYGKFLAAQGLSNEAMKEAISQGKFYELLLEKLGPLQETMAFTSNTYSASIARLKSSWADLQSEAMDKYFDGIKNAINNTTALIEEFKDSILFFIDFVVQKMSACWEGLKEIFFAITDALGSLIKGIASLFGEATNEMSAFELCLRSLGSTLDIVAYAFKTLANAIKIIVNGISGALNALQTAYYNTKDFFNLADDEDRAKMQKLTAQRAAGAAEVKAIWDKQINDTKTMMNELESTWSKKEKEVAKKAINTATPLTLQQKFSPQSAENEALKKSTQKQIDTLKSWWDTEFLLREKDIELMSEGKERELKAEQLRFEKVVSNLNFEIQKKLESGQITQEQALKLYEVEEKHHRAKMKQIAEYSQAYEDLRKNIDNALQENIANALTGKFQNGKDFFKDLFSSMQTSFTQGLAQSMAQAIMSNAVMESFTKTFSTAIEGISGLFKSGASGGIANVVGAGDETGAAAMFGNVLAGGVTGFSFGSMVYNSANAGYSSKADKWKDYGIAAGSLAGASGGAILGSVFGPVGTAIGSVVGGLVGGISSALGFAAFGSKTEQTGQGIQLWSNASKDSISASLYADMKQTTKKWWKKSSKSWTDYYEADEQSLRTIKNTLRSYEYLLEDIGGGVREITVAAGRYENYASVANAGARKLINAFLEGTNINTNAVYNVWASYAQSLNKEVSVALSESLQSYIDTGNSFEAWKLEFEGKSTQALQFQANLAQEQVDRLLETLGANDITIDNYLAYREEAIKKDFDPQTLQNINALGEYLMSAADASKKYEEALKNETSTKLNLIDPYLNKVQKLDELSTQNTNTSEKLLVSILSTLKQSLRLSQESQETLIAQRS